MSPGLLERERAVLAALMPSPAIGRRQRARRGPPGDRGRVAALTVRRASVWRFDEARTSIECLDLYDAQLDEHSSGMVLHAADAPAYFAATSEERVIGAHDARTDRRTREFAVTYLEPLGITSMLDTPVLVHGHFATALRTSGPGRRIGRRCSRASASAAGTRGSRRRRSRSW